ncbi:MAG TPA: RNA polymerase sigma factor [Puia sp.]|nr:RNA polymerase sigma factor [Puia sp.]
MRPNNEKKLAEADLVNSILQGNKAVFGVIIRNTEGLVTQIVVRMISNPEDRKDIIQEVYFRAYRSLPDFSFRSKLSTWIGHIAYNSCVNYLEKKKLVLREDLEEGPAGDETEEILFKKELLMILAAQIGKLTSLYRTMIVLYHQEEMSYADIAQIMDLPEGTVKSYLFRARKMLKEGILAQYKKEEL